MTILPGMKRSLEMERVNGVLEELKGHANPHNLAGMGRYGIRVDKALGVPMPVIRGMAKRIGRNHELAQSIWDSGIHEARILAPLIDDPAKVTKAQMESWVIEVDSWDVCDQLCSNLFDKTVHAYKAARAWATRDEVFVRRAGFVLMAALAVHDKKAEDAPFLEFLDLVSEGSTDDRNFVKKSVNWALRQIGKRNLSLHDAAIRTAVVIDKSESSTARWIAKDALRELRSEAVLARLQRKDLAERRRR